MQYWRRYAYDPAAQRVKSVATPEGTVNYKYNLLGDMTRLSTTTGLDQRFTYDALFS